MDSPKSLPSLGRRGGGWVAAQLVLIAAIFLSGYFSAGLTSPRSTVLQAAGVVLLGLGLVFLLVGIVQLNAVSSLTPFPAPCQEGELTTGGLYRLVRHPLYGAGLLVTLGWSALSASAIALLLTAALALLFEFKARREEAWLLARYPEYAAYRERTRHKFLPYIY